MEGCSSVDILLGELQSLAAGVFGLPSGNDLVAVAQSVSDSAPIVFPLSALIHSPEAFDNSQLLAILNQHNEEDLLAYLTGSSVSRPAGVSRRLAPRNPYRGPPSGLDCVEFETLLEIFESINSDSESEVLNKVDFRKGVQTLIPVWQKEYNAIHGKSPSAEEESRIKFTLERLFHLFASGEASSVPFMKFICGLCMLCKGESSEKIGTALAVYDDEGHHKYSKEILYQFLEDFFTVTLEFSSSEENTLSPAELAHRCTEECFARYDRDRDGKISFQDFAKWYQSAF